MARKHHFFVIWILLTWGAVAGHTQVLTASDQEALWNKANEQFQKAQQPQEYALAAAYLETLCAQGLRNGYLFYNLGNAYLKAGQTGLAILNYRRAELFIPNFPELQENLRYARSLVKAHFTMPEHSQIFRYLFFWHHLFHRETRVWAFLVCYHLAWVVLIVRLSRKHFPFWALLVATALPALFFGGSLGYDRWQELSQPPAVLTGQETIVRKGDSDNYEPLYVEKDGACGIEVRVVEFRGDWCKIELPDQCQGWVKKATLELVALSAVAIKK